VGAAGIIAVSADTFDERVVDRDGHSTMCPSRVFILISQLVPCQAGVDCVANNYLL
jgi:hypothetical protein